MTGNHKWCHSERSEESPLSNSAHEIKKPAANPLFATGRKDFPRYHPYSSPKGTPFSRRHGLLLNAENGRAYCIQPCGSGTTFSPHFTSAHTMPRPLCASVGRYSCPSSPFGFIIVSGAGFVNNFSLGVDKDGGCRYNNIAPKSGRSAAGSALGSGPRGRGFESRRSDHTKRGVQPDTPFCVIWDGAQSFFALSGRNFFYGLIL